MCISIHTACPSGTWGKDCLRDCSCRDIDTVCNETVGCEECPDGFEGGDCLDDINECDNHPCDEHATCNNTIGTFKCVCQAGYTQYNSTVCEGMFWYTAAQDRTQDMQLQMSCSYPCKKRDSDKGI